MLAAGWTSWHYQEEFNPGAERLIQPTTSESLGCESGKIRGPKVNKDLWLAGPGRSVVFIKFFLVDADLDSKVCGCFYPSSQNLNNRNCFNWTENIDIFSEEQFYFGSWDVPTVYLTLIILSVWGSLFLCLDWTCGGSKDFLLDSVMDLDGNSRRQKHPARQQMDGGIQTCRGRTSFPKSTSSSLWRTEVPFSSKIHPSDSSLQTRV